MPLNHLQSLASFFTHKCWHKTFHSRQLPFPEEIPQISPKFVLNIYYWHSLPAVINAGWLSKAMKTERTSLAKQNSPHALLQLWQPSIASLTALMCQAIFKQATEEKSIRMQRVQMKTFVSLFLTIYPFLRKLPKHARCPFLLRFSSSIFILLRSSMQVFPTSGLTFSFIVSCVLCSGKASRFS